MGNERHSGNPTGRPPTVLIVDDSPGQRLLVQAILKEAGFPSVIFAGSGEEGLHLLGRIGRRMIDLVLLELKLPDVDGIETCRRIRQSASGVELPVIMLTADGSEECLEAAFTAGVSDYIQKPVRRAELVARVRAALRLQTEISRRRKRERELVATTQQLEAMNESLLRLSLLDGLTGVANRRCFDHAMNEMWNTCMSDGLPFSLVMLDVDGFKIYNDFYGHAAGDTCLREIAACLAQSLRRSRDFLARYGGEEFAVALPGACLEQAVDVAERLRESVLHAAIPQAPSAPLAVVAISAGVACLLPREGGTQQQLLRSADEALYAAKRKGRNSVVALPVAEIRRA